MVVEPRKFPPGGGGGWEDASIWPTAASSALFPDERVMECDLIAPDGPIEKVTPTDPLAPEARAPAG